MKVVQKKKPFNKTVKAEKPKSKKTKAQTNALNSDKLFLGMQVLQDFRKIGVNPPSS